MKTALIFKSLDLVFQLGCFIVPALVKDPLTGWCVFGGAQILSTLLNKLFLAKEYRATTRIGYELFAIIFCLCGSILLLGDLRNSSNPLSYFVIASCGVSPVLAIWYLGITITEITNTSNKNAEQ